MDIPSMARETGRILEQVRKQYEQKGNRLENLGGITVAVMGCSVNGPGEARAADVGIAGGRGGTGTIFKGGKPVRTLPEQELLHALREEVLGLLEEKLRAL
jgi:(E)-4-hydroxy-3-methylbut-2-enyl-diphosphate synthase